MKARKWDFSRREYEVVDIPDTCSTYKDDFDADVTCPGCGRPVRFADTYTSRRWHDRVGFGYGVCIDCYVSELECEESVEGGDRE